MGKSLYCGLLGSAGEVRRSRSCRSIKKIRKLSQVSHQLMAGELGWKETQMEYYSPCPLRVPILKLSDVGGTLQARETNVRGKKSLYK